MNLSAEVEKDCGDDFALPAVGASPAWDERLAGLVSDLFSPPVLAVVGLGLASRFFTRASDSLWVVYYLFLVVGVPAVYLMWKVRRGEITDFHIRRREQRLRPMLLVLACALAGWLSLWLGQAARVLLVMAGMGAIQVGLLLLVTLRWKISAHGAAAGSLAILACSLYGWLCRWWPGPASAWAATPRPKPWPVRWWGSGWPCCCCG